MSYQSFRVALEDFPILHFHTDRFSAVQAWSIDLDRFSWKKPADRQRLERSLGEPFLLTVDGNPVLIRKIVKWRHGYDEIGVGI
jgi:hypothetical protein